MWNRRKAQITTSINAGRSPRVSGNGSIILNLAQGRGSYALLSRPDGTLTRSGDYYYAETKREPPSAAFDKSQTLIRNGPNDYITMRNGEQKLVRTLQSDGKYKLTRLGKVFFKDKYSQYVAHVPVTIQGVR